MFSIRKHYKKLGEKQRTQHSRAFTVTTGTFYTNSKTRLRQFNHKETRPSLLHLFFVIPKPYWRMSGDTEVTTVITQSQPWLLSQKEKQVHLPFLPGCRKHFTTIKFQPATNLFDRLSAFSLSPSFSDVCKQFRHSLPSCTTLFLQLHS